MEQSGDALALYQKALIASQQHISKSKKTERDMQSSVRNEPNFSKPKTTMTIWEKIKSLFSG